MSTRNKQTIFNTYITARDTMVNFHVPRLIILLLYTVWQLGQRKHQTTKRAMGTQLLDSLRFENLSSPPGSECHKAQSFTYSVGCREVFTQGLNDSCWAVSMSQQGCDIQQKVKVVIPLTFRHRASSIQDRHFATLQRTPFIYLINKYISLSDICLTVHH